MGLRWLCLQHAQCKTQPPCFSDISSKPQTLLFLNFCQHSFLSLNICQHSWNSQASAWFHGARALVIHVSASVHPCEHWNSMRSLVSSAVSWAANKQPLPIPPSGQIRHSVGPHLSKHIFIGPRIGPERNPLGAYVSKKMLIGPKTQVLVNRLFPLFLIGR